MTPHLFTPQPASPRFCECRRKGTDPVHRVPVRFNEGGPWHVVDPLRSGRVTVCARMVFSGDEVGSVEAPTCKQCAR